MRPVAVLDAAVLIPPGLRDLLLSCAHVGVFRPVWQDEILDEVRRNATCLLVQRQGLTADEATMAVKHTLEQMATAFPDARGPVHARSAGHGPGSSCAGRRGNVDASDASQDDADRHRGGDDAGQHVPRFAAALHDLIGQAGG